MQKVKSRRMLIASGQKSSPKLGRVQSAEVKCKKLIGPEWLELRQTDGNHQINSHHAADKKQLILIARARGETLKTSESFPILIQPERRPVRRDMAPDVTHRCRESVHRASFRQRIG